MILLTSPSVKMVTKLERIGFRTFDCIIPNQNSAVRPVYVHLMTKAGVRFGML